MFYSSIFEKSRTSGPRTIPEISPHREKAREENAVAADYNPYEITFDKSNDERFMNSARPPVRY